MKKVKGYWMIPENKFNELVKNCSCQIIAKQGKAKKIIHIEGEMWICTGSVSSSEEGYISVSAVKCQHISEYTGKYKPLDYSSCHHEVTQNLRPRGYCGMKVIYDKRTYVMLGDAQDFKYYKSEVQASLF